MTNKLRKIKPLILRKNIDEIVKSIDIQCDKYRKPVKDVILSYDLTDDEIKYVFHKLGVKR